MKKTIYMTYKRTVPNIVFNRWIKYNPNNKINLSLDKHCISFLKKFFNNYIMDIFRFIKFGAYKADLWRLCKLYIHSGIYADVDLVPYINLDILDKDVTFYSCLSIDKNSIFQAFIVNFSKPKNPLFLFFIISFLINKPYLKKKNAPCNDMYNCIKYNLNNIDPKPDTKYTIDVVKIPIKIGISKHNTKKINLYYFPKDIKYYIKLKKNQYKDQFKFKIINNFLFITRIDARVGWGYNHTIDICINSKEVIYLFKENIGHNNNWVTSYVTYKNKKILDSRDIKYYKNGKAW